MKTLVKWQFPYLISYLFSTDSLQYRHSLMIMAEEVEVDPTHAIAQGGVDDLTRGCFGSLIVLMGVFLTLLGVSLLIGRYLV